MFKSKLSRRSLFAAIAAFFVSNDKTLRAETPAPQVPPEVVLQPTHTQTAFFVKENDGDMFLHMEGADHAVSFIVSAESTRAALAFLQDSQVTLIGHFCGHSVVLERYCGRPFLQVKTRRPMFRIMLTEKEVSDMVQALQANEKVHD